MRFQSMCATREKRLLCHGAMRHAMWELSWSYLQCQADLREENSFSRSGLATHAFSRLEPREPGDEMKSSPSVPLPLLQVQVQRSYSLYTSSSASTTATRQAIEQIGPGVGSVLRDAEKQHNQIQSVQVVWHASWLHTFKKTGGYEMLRVAQLGRLFCLAPGRTLPLPQESRRWAGAASASDGERARAACA